MQYIGTWVMQAYYPGKSIVCDRIHETIKNQFQFIPFTNFSNVPHLTSTYVFDWIQTWS